MHTCLKSLLLVVALATAQPAIAQAPDDELKMAALEALISAPPERALPLVKKVLAGDNSDELKSRALFILSQNDLPEAQIILLDTARSNAGPLRLEAIRMIGIGGDPAAIAGLGEIYESGDMETKQSVLHAYMIAGDSEAVYRLAANADSDEEFEAAVHMLGAMGAPEAIARLPMRPGASESLIHALAVSGDSERLAAIALESDDPEQQLQAIHGLGIAGGENVDHTLIEIYQATGNYEVKQAVMHTLMVSDSSDSLLQLFRDADEAQEKRDLLRLLVIMDDEVALQVIEETLGGQR
jgi:HEAT repeat protein